MKPENISDEGESITHKFNELSDRQKSEVAEKLVDDEAFKKWSEENGSDSREEYLLSLIGEYDPEKEAAKGDVPEERDESNSDLAGKPREVPECGLSCIMTREAYEKIRDAEYGHDGQVIGRDDGLFTAPTDQINELLERCDGDISKISGELGVDFKSDDLVRISISKEDADKLSPAYPTGRETSANDLWSGGGKTILVDKETGHEKGVGLDEFVIDPIDINNVDDLEITDISTK